MEGLNGDGRFKRYDMNEWCVIGDTYEGTASFFINADQILPHKYLENQLVYIVSGDRHGWSAIYSMSDSDVRYFDLDLNIWSA